MFFATFLVLFVSAVLAIPSHSRISRTFHRRTGVPSRIHHRLESTASSGSDVSYDLNWAGAVQEGDIGTFTYVEGTFNVPQVWGKTGDGGSIWVGIDGTWCGQGLLQAGIDFTVSDDDQVVYDAWYEWYPDWSYGFDNPVSIFPGDTVKVTIEAFTNTSGLAVVENLTNGEVGSKYINSTYALCQKSAEWIVEDYQTDTGAFAPFSNFSTITFENAEAIGNHKTYTPSGSAIVDIEQNNQILTSTSTSNSGLVIRRL